MPIESFAVQSGETSSLRFCGEMHLRQDDLRPRPVVELS
jgi:hypothetical protein